MKNIMSILFTVLLSFMFFVGYTSAEEGTDPDIIIIVNKGAPQADLSKTEIQKIFTGKTTMWISNEKIIVAILKNDDIHKAFLKKYVKRNSSQFKATWKRMLFTGKGDMPKKFGRIEDLVAFVSGNRLAIGYMTRNAGDDRIKIISH